MSVQRYPLAWPEGWKRTASGARRHAAFNRKEITLDAYGPGSHRQTSKRLSIAEAIQRVFAELQRLGVKHVQEDCVVSTNLRVNLSGIPRGDQGEPSDPGAAVYWELKGARQCIAIDQYWRVADNIAAIAATLEAMRAIERHGGAEILQRAFLGFAALPEKASQSWRLHLGFKDEEVVTVDAVQSAFRGLAQHRHPDKGGDRDKWDELCLARENALRDLQKGPMKANNPTTPAEWQEAVNTAHVMRVIADCEMYGLIKFSGKIDVGRCDELLEQGAHLGYRPEPGIFEKTFGASK
jgi:hypothetical protein